MALGAAASASLQGGHGRHCINCGSDEHVNHMHSLDRERECTDITAVGCLLGDSVRDSEPKSIEIGSLSSRPATHPAGHISYDISYG